MASPDQSQSQSEFEETVASATEEMTQDLDLSENEEEEVEEGTEMETDQESNVGAEVSGVETGDEENTHNETGDEEENTHNETGDDSENTHNETGGEEDEQTEEESEADQEESAGEESSEGPSIIPETQDINLGLIGKGKKRGPQPTPKGPPVKTRKVVLDVGPMEPTATSSTTSSKKKPPSPSRPKLVTKKGRGGSSKETMPEPVVPAPSNAKKVATVTGTKNMPKGTSSSSKDQESEEPATSPRGLPVARKMIKAARPNKVLLPKAKMGRSKTDDSERNEGEKKPKNKRKDPDTLIYTRAIYRVFKEVCPENTISTGTMGILNSFMRDIFDRIVLEASILCKRHHKHTLGAREIETATKLVLSGQLAKHAVSEGMKALHKYEQSRDTTMERSLITPAVPAKPTNAKKTKKIH